MIPRDYITAWRDDAPWAEDAQVVALVFWNGAHPELRTRRAARHQATSAVPAQEGQRPLRPVGCPAITMPGRPLAVWFATPVGGRPVGDRDLSGVQSFVDCYAGRFSDKAALDEPGDVVVRNIEVRIPKRRDGIAACTGHVSLCVRLADEEANDDLVGHVAVFRKPGMVVKYWDRRSLAVGVRPFHAVLVCGAARNPDEPTSQDMAVEAFLRAAEPPGHDDWVTTAALKAEYQRGYGRALEQLKAKVNEELRTLVVQRPRQGTQGPDKLRQRFPIGRKGSKTSEPSLFSFSGLKARFTKGRWLFVGSVAPTGDAKQWWSAIRLVELAEDGSSIGRINVEKIVEVEGAESVTLEDGEAVLFAKKGISEIHFSGVSAPVAGNVERRGELSLEVSGRVEEAS